MISLVINADTRPVCPQFEGMFRGVRSRDFLTHGVINKKKFFSNHEIEVIVFVDEHESLTNEQYASIREICDCTVVRRHSKYYRGASPFSAFNDVNYLHAMSLARGEYIAHFDQDIAAFARHPSTIDWMLSQLNEWRFISYQSVNHPAPCHAPEYENKWWASTRFILFERSTVDFGILERAIMDNKWFYDTYGAPPRINPWTEQFLGIIGNYKVLYPEPRLDEWCVFPWMKYRDGILEKLNAMPYSEVADSVIRAGGAGAFYDGINVDLMGV